MKWLYVQFSYQYLSLSSYNFGEGDPGLYVDSQWVLWEYYATGNGWAKAAIAGETFSRPSNESATVNVGGSNYPLWAAILVPDSYQIPDPDLTFTEASLAASHVPLNGSISVHFTLKNAGNEAAGASYVGVYFSKTDTFSKSASTLYGNLAVNSIAAGGEISETLNFSVPTSMKIGDYFIFLVADNGDTIAESNAHSHVSSGLELTVAPPALFTTGADNVDFNNLQAIQITAILNGSSKYNGLGGSDAVVLPTEADETKSLGDGEKLGWHDSLNSLFHTDSRKGDNYLVTGSDGDYFIDCGAGNDTIAIANPNPTARSSSNTIVAGSGNDTISITGCNGDNHVTAGSGQLALTINGYGDNKLLLLSAPPSAIGGSITTTQDPNFANHGSFTVQFAIDATATFDGSLTGDGLFEVIGGDLKFSGGDSFTGDVLIDQARLELTYPTAIGSGVIELADDVSGAALQIDGLAMPTNIIKGFKPQPTTVIDLRSVAFTGRGTATLGAGNVLTVVGDATVENAPSYDLNLDPNFDYTGLAFSLVADGHGGTQIVFGDAPTKGKTADGETIKPGDQCNDYGAALYCVVMATASIVVETGGTASYTTILSGGQGTIEKKGSGKYLLIDTDGSLDVLAGGATTGDTIAAGGTETVAAGATSTGASVSGVLDVSGTATNAVVQAGGKLIVESGGVAKGTTIDSGGLELVKSGGSANGATIAGGELEIASGGAASGVIAFKGANGLLKIDAAPVPSVTIAGFGVGDSLDLAYLPMTEGQTTIGYVANATNSGGVLTISDGAAGSAQFDLTGAYDLADFQLGVDANNDIVVTGRAVTTIASSSGATSLAADEVLEISAAFAGSITFAATGATLWLDKPAGFTATISGLVAGDFIDLPTIGFDSTSAVVGYAENGASNGGTLTISDGTNSASLSLLGGYSSGDFTTRSDGHGGTLVVMKGLVFTEVRETFTNLYCEPNGISNSDEIVGGYYDTSSGSQFISDGFTYTSAAGYASLTVPLELGGGGGFGSTSGTAIDGINSTGEIVGYYVDANNGLDYGFAYNPASGGGLPSSGWLHINDPSATGGTVAMGVNDNGEIVGYFVGASGMQGFVDVDGAYTTISHGTSDAVNGVNNAGDLVGSFVDSLGTHGFLDIGGVFTAIDDPSAHGYTVATGVNNHGEIVGYYKDSIGAYHGFVDINGTFTTVDDPLMNAYGHTANTGTIITGVNDAGTLVGGVGTLVNLGIALVRDGFVARLTG